jgi:hypothetical protein
MRDRRECRHVLGAVLEPDRSFAEGSPSGGGDVGRERGYEAARWAEPATARISRGAAIESALLAIALHQARV